MLASLMSSTFEELQLFSNALMETSNVFHENYMIVNVDSEGDCLLVKFGVALDILIILLSQVSSLDSLILFMAGWIKLLLN